MAYENNGGNESINNGIRRKSMYRRLKIWLKTEAWPMAGGLNEAAINSKAGSAKYRRNKLNRRWQMAYWRRGWRRERKSEKQEIFSVI
jgi:hypothetical protein